MVEPWYRVNFLFSCYILHMFQLKYHYLFYLVLHTPLIWGIFQTVFLSTQIKCLLAFFDWYQHQMFCSCCSVYLSMCYSLSYFSHHTVPWISWPSQVEHLKLCFLPTVNLAKYVRTESSSEVILRVTEVAAHAIRHDLRLLWPSPTLWILVVSDWQPGSSVGVVYQSRLTACFLRQALHTVWFYP